MNRRVFLAAVAAASGVRAFGQVPAYQPRVLAHLCTWHRYRGYQKSWQHTTTKPLRGLYDSRDIEVLADQLAQMRGAGIAPLTSWWGPDGDAGDEFLDILTSVPWEHQRTDVPAGVLYEGSGRLRARRDGWLDFDDTFNRERFSEDMRHLYGKYLSRFPERFFRQDGRFVVMAWPSHIYRGSFAQLGKNLMSEMPLYLVSTDLLTRPYIRPDALDVIGGFAAVSAYGIYLTEIARELGGTLNEEWQNRWRAMANAWDQWLAVNEPQVRIALPLQFCYDDTKERGDGNPVLTVDYARAEEMVRIARETIGDPYRSAGRYLPWTTLASFNEHFEGTAVEPTDRHGTRLLDIIRDGFRPMPMRY